MESRMKEGAAMTRQLELSDQEWGLVVGLLRSEARELSSEVRRTDTSRVKLDLMAREHMVHDLLSRLQVQAAAPVTVSDGVSATP
jgi:hypothetical protein